MREVAGRRQSRFAECPAKRANGDAIVSYGGLRKDITRVREVPERLLERCSMASANCGILELDDAFDFLRWRLNCRFGALELFEFLPNRESSCKNRNFASTMAPEPISPEEARRRRV